MHSFEDVRDGRQSFAVRDADADYSGLNIANRYLECKSLEKSFFNGADLTNCAFRSVALNNAEFTEASIVECHFERCDLSASDFVDSAFDDVQFYRCTFEKGEWRSASFTRCYFLQCSFDHTTVTLCTFRDCTFDERSIESIQHRAAYFNVFSHNGIAAHELTDAFASRNFGVPATESANRGRLPDGTTIEDICRLNNTGKLRSIAVVDAANALCSSLKSEHKRRSSALSFFGLILTILTEERRISATSLILIEDIMTNFAGTISDRDLLMAALATVLSIHEALLLVAAEGKAYDDQAGVLVVKRLTIYFSESHSKQHIYALRDALSTVAGRDPDALRIESVRSGSTFVEVATTGLFSAATILTALNYVLRQATVTVEEAARLRKAIRRGPSRRPRSPRSTDLVLRQAAPVQALLQPQAAIPELARVAEAVSRDGRTLVEVDEPANVSASIQ